MMLASEPRKLSSPLAPMTSAAPVQEIKCEACNRDIARPLLFALAALFSLFAVGHLTGVTILMTLAITLEHASLFVVAILGNKHWECIAWNFSQQNGCN